MAKNSEVDILAKAIELICKDGLKIKIISNLSPSLIKLVQLLPSKRIIVLLEITGCSFSDNDLGELKDITDTCKVRFRNYNLQTDKNATSLTCKELRHLMHINLIQDSLSFHLTEPCSVTLENLTSVQTNVRKINIVVSTDNNPDLQNYLHLLLKLLKNSPNILSLSLDFRIK